MTFNYHLCKLAMVKLNLRNRHLSFFITLIGLASLIWYILRTGTKPSRAEYPCQKIARKNIEIFGLPALYTISHNFKRKTRGEKYIFFCLFLLFFVLSTFGLTRARILTLNLFTKTNRLSQEKGEIIGYTTGSRVVWVNDDQAASWNGQTDYWNYVNQNAVNRMTDNGLMALTGTNSVADAWRVLIPNYLSGQKIAIKVNFNNIQACNETTGEIDAIIEPVNALVAGLKQIGVSESDIWIYDATRRIPDRFVSGSDFPAVRYFAGCRESIRFSSTNPSANINFRTQVGVQPPASQKSTDVLVDTNYLINMPIIKKHGCQGVTLGFKNHFGSIQRPDLLHNYACTGTNYYNPDFSPLVDIYQNPNIVNKTVLIVGDAIFGHPLNNIQPPRMWLTFANNVPKSLFFSTDPVAVDSVMTDLLDKESAVPASSRDYLILAERLGLGVFEKGDPWRGASGYSRINLIKCEGSCSSVSPALTSTPFPQTSTPTPSGELPGDANGDGRVDGVDYVIWFNNYGISTNNGSASGDFDGSGRVEGVDYVIWFNHYGQIVGPTATPTRTPTPIRTPTPGLSATPTRTPTPGPSPTPPSGQAYRAFTDDSYWNTPFPVNAPIDSRNAEYIADSQNSSHTQNFLGFTAAPGNTQAFGLALYWGQASDPLYTLTDEKHFTSANPVQVHIPLGAQPQSGSDGEIAVFDLSTNQVIEMSGASFDGTNWHIGATLDRYMLSSNGLDSRVAGANDSRNHGHRGVPPSARGVRLDEVRAGAIRHRLECYWWATGTQTVNHYWPMAGDEGSKGGIVPEGTVIRIKPSVNLASRRLSAPALVIAKALQDYGCMIEDNSGAGNRLKLERNESAWQSIGIREDSLAPIPWSDWEFIQGGYSP